MITIKQPLNQIADIGQQVTNIYATKNSSNYIGKIILIEKKRYVKGLAYKIKFNDIEFWATGKYILNNLIKSTI